MLYEYQCSKNGITNNSTKCCNEQLIMLLLNNHWMNNSHTFNCFLLQLITAITYLQYGLHISQYMDW